MDILIFTNNDAGLFKFRRELLEELVKDHNVYVSVPDGEFREEITLIGCEVMVNRLLDRHGTNPLKDLKLLKYYIQIIKTFRPNIVLTYTVKPNVYGGLACQRLGVPYVANITGLGTAIENRGILQNITLHLYKIGISGAQRVFFQNNENKDFMLKQRAICGDYAVLPGSGVNIEEHCYMEYPPDGKRVIFSTIGRIMKDKGIDEILEAAKILKKQYPNCEFRIIGYFDEKYEEKIKKYEYEGVIRYIEYQKNIHPFLADSHAIIHASYHEGMSNVLLEGAATGRPVIASNVPGCREIYDEGISGIGFNPGNVQDLIKALRKFMNLSYEEKREMGKAGRRKVEENFDRRIVVKAYMQEINKVKI